MGFPPILAMAPLSVFPEYGVFRVGFPHILTYPQILFFSNIFYPCYRICIHETATLPNSGSSTFVRVLTAVSLSRFHPLPPPVNFPGYYLDEPDRTKCLRSIRPLKVSTRDFSWVKDGQCFWLTTYHTCSAETSRKSGALIYPEPLGPPRPVAGYIILSPWDQNASLQISCSSSISHSAVRHYKFRVTYIQHRKMNNEKTAALIIFRFFLCKMGKCCIQHTFGVTINTFWDPDCDGLRGVWTT